MKQKCDFYTGANMNTTGRLRLLSLKRLNRKRMVRRLEAGDADSFGFITYTSYMWFILMMAIIFAFVGFYRIGANYANDYGTRIGAVNSVDPSTGELIGKQKQESYLSQFTGDSHDCPDCYAQVFEERQAWGHFTIQSSFPSLFNIEGIPDNFDIKAQSRIRLERFYPGPAKCDASGACFE